MYFSQKYEYVETNNSNNFLSWRSSRISNEKFEPLEEKNTPIMSFNKVLPYLKIVPFKFLAQKIISYTHENIVNIYIVYSMQDITDAKGSELLRYGLFGSIRYDTNNKLVGYGVGFGTQKYTHDDGKKARNLVILGASPNALVLGKGSIKITTNDIVAVLAKDKLKTKYKNIFAKGYSPNWSEEIFVVNKIQNIVHGTYLINDLNGEEIKDSFYKKEFQKTNQKEFRIEKVIKKKANKLYVKWKGYDHSFNS